MKKIIPIPRRNSFLIAAIVSALGALFTFGVNAQILVTPSSLQSEPSSTYLSNSTFKDNALGNDGQQARRTHSGDVRGVYQAFTWSTDELLTAVGFMVSPSFTTSVDSNFLYTADQIWQLDIIEVKSSTSGSIKSDGQKISLSFTLPASAVIAGQYLDLSFSEPLSLINGSTYVVNLYPTEDKNQRILFASATGKEILGGGQSLGDGATSFNFPAASTDQTFYAAVIPEPASLILMGSAGILVFLLRRRRNGGPFLASHG